MTQLEYLLLVLTFLPSVREKISSMEGDGRIVRAQTVFPFQGAILPQLLIGVPFLTVPFLAAKQAFFWVELVRLGVFFF